MVQNRQVDALNAPEFHDVRVSQILTVLCLTPSSFCDINRNTYSTADNVFLERFCKFETMVKLT